MDIDQKLEKARERAEGYGELYGNKETADDFLKATYALVYEDAPEGSVAERDSWVRRDPRYTTAIERKKDAYTLWKTAETYMKLLLVEAEVWRSKEATKRRMNESHS